MFKAIVLVVLSVVATGISATPTYTDCDPSGIGHLVNINVTPMPINLDETFTATGSATLAAGHPSLNGTVLVLTAGYELFGHDLYVCKDGKSDILPAGTCVLDFCNKILGEALCATLSSPTVTNYKVDQTVGPIKLPAILEPFICSTWDFVAPVYTADQKTQLGCLQISKFQVKDNHCLDAGRLKRRRELELKMLLHSRVKKH